MVVISNPERDVLRLRVTVCHAQAFPVVTNGACQDKLQVPVCQD